MTPTNNLYIDPFLQSLTSRWRLNLNDPGLRISSVGHPFPEKLLPLDECILEIIWEGHDSYLLWTLISMGGSFEALVVLLRAAALHQAKSDIVGYHLLTSQHDLMRK